MKWMLPGFFDQPLLQPDLQTPPNTPDTWTTDMDGLWTDTEADPDPLTDSGTDGDLDLWSEIDTDLAADNKMRPRYEDYLRRYLEGDTDLSMLNADAAAAPEKTQQPAPKPKEQILSELAPKISKPGITPGRATIEAQRLYADAERIFGPNADTVLETFEAGQEPRKFFDGIKTAYLSGKIGSRAALENSTAAAYLTEEQREAAYTLGGMAAPKVAAGTDNGAESISSTNPEGKKADLLSILEGGTIEEKRTAFRKAFQEGQISTRISPQKQARHIRGTKAFLNYDVSMMRNGDHPSYIREDLSENDLNRLVVSRMQGVVRIVGNHYYEYVYCDEIIGYYYSKNEGRYLPTKCAQIAYALGSKNIHIIPVKKK